MQDAWSPANQIFSLPRFDLPNGVANATVALPSFNYGSLVLLALGTRGNHPNQTLIVHYRDGASSVLQQRFSDWHTPQHYPNESVAIAMPSRFAKDGSVHPGTYNVYQYKFVLDASKPVASLDLPKNDRVVVLSVSLEE